MANSCRACGLCCKLFYINLNQEEYASGKYKTVFEDITHFDNFQEAKKCGANLLAKNSDGSCIYLKDGKCSIHLTRPAVCRKFFCNSKAKKFQKMIEEINKN